MKIPAVYMRGGTSKGLFFRAGDLPADPAARDRILLRIVGSPDPYGRQIDGMGGATSSTSKVVIVWKSGRPDCDVEYLFGAVAIDAPVIDWSGNCGNLTSAVGPYAIGEGLAPAPPDGIAAVRMWQANVGKRIIAHVPMRRGHVLEEGDFLLDGVAFPAAEIKLEFLDPGGGGGDAGSSPMFPTGNPADSLDVPGVGRFAATLIDAGNPTIIIHAAGLGLKGTESQSEINSNAALLDRCETIRAHGAVAMGLSGNPAGATRNRPHTPKLAFIGEPQGYLAASGRRIEKSQIDLTVRILSMGRLHHAITGTGAIALAVAAVIPGTVVRQAFAGRRNDGMIRLGHPSGITETAAEASLKGTEWTVAKAIISRSARRLMEGWVNSQP